jgi:hypothetical protein
MARPRKLTAHDVFTPSSFPEYTYVARGDDDLEAKLRFALQTKGQIVSLSGPSKSGKTVLVEKVVGKEHLVPVVGAGVKEPDQIWGRVLDWLDAPAERTRSRGQQLRTFARAGARAGGDLILARAEGDINVGLLKGTIEGELEKRRGLEEVIEQIGGSDHVVLVDDFHYMPREVQVEVAKHLKEAARRELRIVTAAVPHRADDVVRANAELRGRVSAVDVSYWPVTDLARIATAGFEKLNIDIDEASAERLAREAAGSPQLMQALCLYACFVMQTTEQLAKREPRTLTERDQVQTCRLTSTVTDFRSLVDILDAGPNPRAERKTYELANGTRGDVYRAVLKAIAGDPTALHFRYDDLMQRLASVCVGETPQGSSIVGACAHMSKLADDQLPTHRVFDWDDARQVLDLPDPYFLFYLRWSGRLALTA